MRLLPSLAVASALAGCGGREAAPSLAEAASARGSDATAASAPEFNDADSEAVSDAALADFDAAGALAETTDADAAMPTRAAVTCSGAEDCEASPLFFPSVAACCVANTCIFGDEAANSSCGEPDAQVIAAANYDLSCASDSDCALVPLGNFCYPGANNCALGAISQRALPQYQLDVSQTYAARCFEVGNCAVTAACCRNGQCQSDNCFPEVETLPACANAGGVCRPTSAVEGGLVCTGDGPPDSCAYPDETCCLGRPLSCPGINSFQITPVELLGTQPSMVSITTLGHVSSIAWTASGCNNYPGGPSPAYGQVGGFADPSSASTTFNCGTCVGGQVAITVTIAGDQVEPGSDAATNVCLGAPFTTFAGLVNCEVPGTLECLGPAVPCGSVCSNLNGDPANCGACGSVCAPGSSCNSGVCVH